ncbi:NADPH-dependent FMN reductase [Bailinhaonella thermotolerans]|uniref:NADPH-dependent oxidoreductase n=1 Tax=Bailinhaonella thermotolerans TaxID=1070861 RepID=A0A3A4AXR1_9ACTN|nr:NADPH-dependent oxidoreductase [Bailinhaonella thermotolerans]
MSGELVVLVGNPRSGSRTRAAGVAAAEAVRERAGLGGGAEVVDLAGLGPRLLAPGAHADVEVALELVAGASVLVVASPTYKGTYTGLLKSFLDRLPPGALSAAVALPLLVMGDPRHALAVEAHLRPLLVELGAVVPTPGLALLESDLPRLPEILAVWAARVAPQAAAFLRQSALQAALGEPVPQAAGLAGADVVDAVSVIEGSAR